MSNCWRGPDCEFCKDYPKDESENDRRAREARERIRDNARFTELLKALGAE